MIEFTVGQKVAIPLTKGTGCNIANCISIKRALQFGTNFLYIVNINISTGVVELSNYEHQETGEMFLIEDIKPLTDDSPTHEIVQALIRINEEVQESDS